MFDTWLPELSYISLLGAGGGVKMMWMKHRFFLKKILIVKSWLYPLRMISPFLSIRHQFEGPGTNSKRITNGLFVLGSTHSHILEGLFQPSVHQCIQVLHQNTFQSSDLELDHTVIFIPCDFTSATSCIKYLFNFLKWTYCNNIGVQRLQDFNFW